MRLTLESAGWIKQIALPRGGGPHPVSWRTKQNKSADLPPSERESFPPNGLCVRTSAFHPAFGLPLRQCLFLLSSRRPELHRWFSCIPGLRTRIGGAPPAVLDLRPVDFGLANLQNHRSQFLFLFFSLCLSSVPLENPDYCSWDRAGNRVGAGLGLTRKLMRKTK